MAGKNEGVSQVVSVASVFHHREFNGARLSGDYGNTKEAISSLTKNGWWFTGDGTIEVEKISDVWKERAVKELTAKWESLKNAAVADAKSAPALHVFETIQTRKGKLIVPDYMAVSGNRRLTSLPEANVNRYVASKPDNVIPLITEVLVIVQSFASDKDRLVAQILENEGKTQGFAGTSNKDKIMGAKRILEYGGLQADIRKAYKDGMGQKLYGILVLATRFPDLDIVNRLIELKPEDPRFVRFEGIKFSDLPKLVLRSDSDALGKENAKLRTSGKETMRALSSEDLEQFLQDGKTGVNDPKIMKKENIVALSTQNPNTAVQDVAKSIVNNNQDTLSKYVANAVAYNALGSLIDQGVGPDLESILVSLTKAQDLAVAVKSAKAALAV
jgi:hypothetical protein